jgi:hypothetical protein
MKRYAWMLAALVCTGCVERRYVVYTDPPGALVLQNGVPIGASPADARFEYYGNYHFTVIKDGYETLQVDQKINAPWYEFPGLDFFSENLWPLPVKDRREFRYRLEPRHIPNTDELLKDAQNLRNRGLSLGPGSAPPPSATLPGPSPVTDVPPATGPAPQPAPPAATPAPQTALPQR